MVENQAYLFLVFSFTGMLIGILFDFFKVLRKTYKTLDVITYIEDILFWILTGILIIYNIWFFNDGEIRLFMILGIIIGALLYTLTISYFVIKIINFIMSKIKIITTFLCKIIKKIVEIIINFTKFLKKLFNFENKKGNFEKSGE